MHELDALTMVPGIVWVHWVAWFSNDFIFKISALSWVWCCICSMLYHASHCDKNFLKYDLRSQWISQAFMTLSTPQSSLPLVIGGLAPVGKKGRIILNGIGGLYFVWHHRRARMFMALSYMLYFGQFFTKLPFMHSAFHLCLNYAGGIVVFEPVKKYHVPIDPRWAYVVELVGIIFLIPKFIFKNKKNIFKIRCG
jgi:hypothetical protein